MQINKTWVVIACISFNIGSISYAFVSNSMNNALKTLYIVFEISKDNQSFFAGALTSSSYVGAFFGAILTTFIKKYHTGILIADICLFVGSSLLIFSDIYTFFIGRLIAGVGCGICAVCQPVFIRQFSPTSMYSSMGGILSTVFSFGYFLTMLYGVWFPTTDNITSPDQLNQYFWRIYFFVGGIPSLIRIIVMKTIYNFQTPIFYIQNNQDDKALTVLKKIYQSSNYQELLENIREQSQTQNKQVELGVTIRKHKKQFQFGLFLMFIFQFCGFNAVVQYSTQIFNDSQTQKTAQFLSFLISVLKWILYSFAGTITLKYYGRRKPLLAGLTLMLIANFGIFLFSYLNNDDMIIVFIFVFVFANFSSTGPIVPVYMPEFVPQQLISYCYYTFWFYSIIILLVFPIAIKNLGMENCFLFFAVITLLGVVIFYKYGVETMNKTNQEIYQLFKKNVTDSLVQMIQ
ncbi:unnamed protein product [Paramecium primaurelia]|uniref:Major facilitator superfamily (MFS) profile domain-containing protein n=1 Tax=Paramecium primaurelia TaxID=5886 RepID=A0A8S1JMB9_PARPR|nr:unnamed protein product [Paramecium primaurelia]